MRKVMMTAVMMLAVSFVSAATAKPSPKPLPFGAEAYNECSVPPSAFSVKKFSWKLDLTMDIYASLAYDIGESEWLTGYEKDIVHLLYGGEKAAYLAVSHLFNANRKGKGTIGGAVGIVTGRAGDVIQDLAERIAPNLAKGLGPLGKISNYISIQFHGGYRLSPAPDQSPWVYAVGGRLKVPLGTLKDLLFK